jgi:hypothetical protein
MTRFIMRSAILSASVGSSGAHPSPESSRAVPSGPVPLRELLQEPGELARQPCRLEEVRPRARKRPTLELADKLVALVRLYAPRRVDVDDRHRR